MIRIHTLLALITSVTLANTSTAQAPLNDECANAISISCGETISGNTSEASQDSLAGDCGTSIQAPGVWYSFVGTDEAVTISTCGNLQFDTKLNVYRGACDGLICVAGNDDGGNCDTGSTVGFPATIGITYFILVQGYQGATGEFELSIACAPLTHDFCLAAESISCNQSVPGSTLDATDDMAPLCETGIQAPGVWYTFTGIDDPVVMSTCETFDYDTRINVYQGTCDALVCVVGNDDTPDVGTCSTVNFQPQADLTYYVLVQGYQGETGTFNLELACQTCPAPTGVFVSASDTSAFVFWQSLNPEAIYVIEYGPFGFQQGSGTLVTGTVGNSPNATINGLSLGTEYAIYIHEECGAGDVSGTVGAITFNTLAAAPPTNSNCAGALPITCDSLVVGDTQLSYFSPGPVCGAAPITSKGLWYSFTGDGSTVTFSTCGTADFDTKISVFNGTCDSLSCVAGGDDAPGCANNSSLLSFPTDIGTMYFVLIHGFNDAAGTFTLSMGCAPTCAPVAANDGCTNATIISPVDLGACESATGDNSCAFVGAMPNPPCDEYAPIVDLWYSFNTGAQSDHTVIIQTGSAAEISAALYGGCEGMDHIQCFANITAPVELTGLELNTTYYIRAWNHGGADAGTFTICIETDLPIGIAEVRASAGIHIWPNPATEQLMINNITAIRIAVLDLQGRVVLSMPTSNASNITVDIAALAPGSYIITSEGGLIGRFVKE